MILSDSETLLRTKGASAGHMWPQNGTAVFAAVHIPSDAVVACVYIYMYLSVILMYTHIYIQKRRLWGLGFCIAVF